MPSLEFMFGAVLTVIAIVVAGIGVYFQAAERYGWKPRAGRLKAMLSWAQSRLLFVLAVLGAVLLVSSWVMYEWPQKPIEKIVTHNVPTPDPTQTNQIKTLADKLALDEAKIAEYQRQKPPAVPPHQRVVPAPSPASNSGHVEASGEGTAIGAIGSIGTFNAARDPVEQHKAEIQAVALFMKQGEAISNAFVQKDDPDLITAQYHEWYARVDAYLSNLPDPTYSAQFETAHPMTAIGLNAHSTVGNGYWAEINAKTATLSTMLAALEHS